MTPPQTSTEIALQLGQLARELDVAVKEIGQLDEAAQHARSRAVVTEAREFLSAEGAMDMRKWIAREKSAPAVLDADIADAKVRAARERINSLKVRIDVGRSLGTAVRAEIALGSMGGTP